MKTLLLVVLCSIAIESAYAQQLPPYQQINGLSILQTNIDARTAGFGNSRLATTTDGNNIFTNLAKQPWTIDQGEMKKHTVSGGYRQFNAAAIYYSSFSYADRDGTYFSMGFAHLDGGGHERSFTQGNDYSDWVLKMGFAQTVSEHLSVSFTANLLQSTLSDRYIDPTLSSEDLLGSYRGQSFSADIGSYYSNVDDDGQGFTAGFELANIGMKMNYGKAGSIMLPARIGLGATNTWNVGRKQSVLISYEVARSLAPAIPTTVEENSRYQATSVAAGWGRGKWMQYSFGTEYKILKAADEKDALFLRMGYSLNTRSLQYSSLSGGVGVHYKGCQVDLAYAGTPSLPNVAALSRFQVGVTIEL